MTTDTHFFSAKLAVEVGIAGATILGNLAYLQVQHEYAGNRAFEYEGRWYVRHSYESLQEWHPYLSIDQIRRIMKQLQEGGYVVKSHLGKPFDRTLYWSVGLAIAHSAESPYGRGEIARSDVAKSPDVQQTDNKIQREGKPRSQRKKSKTPIPDDFTVSDRVKEWARKNGHTKLYSRCESFVFKSKKSGAMYADWDAAFMLSIRENWANL